MGIPKFGIIELQQPTKAMQFLTTGYNLKKYLKFIENRVKNGVGSAVSLKLLKTTASSSLILIWYCTDN